MIPDREPRGTVPVVRLETNEVLSHGVEIVKSRIVIGDAVPRTIYHSPSTTEQGLVNLAHEIDNSRSWLYDPMVVSNASALGTTVSSLVNNWVTQYVAGFRTGVFNEVNYGGEPLSPLIEQRGLRRLYREGRNQVKARERQEMKRMNALGR